MKHCIRMSLVIVFLFMLGITPSQSAGKYTIQKMTSKVQSALEGRKSRFEMIRALKNEGSVGETNQGYLKALRPGEKVNDIVEQENKDRAIIYKTIIEQNNLRGALETVEKVFGQEQRERAEAGDHIQLEDGSWVQK